MPVTSVAVSVTTSATLLASCPSGDINGRSYLIVNNGSAAVYLGGSTVTTSTGTPIAAAAGVSVFLDNGESIYGVAESTQDVRVTELTGSR